MGTLFHLSEILKFAIEKEEEAERLYENLSSEAATSELQIFFAGLAQEEEGHKKFYESMMQATAKWSQSEDTEEYESYMRELIKISRTAIAPTDFSNARLVLDYAIAREKDSVLLYAGLINYVPPADRKGIYAIVQEEVKHAAMLTRIKETI